MKGIMCNIESQGGVEEHCSELRKGKWEREVSGKGRWGVRAEPGEGGAVGLSERVAGS